MMRFLVELLVAIGISLGVCQLIDLAFYIMVGSTTALALLLLVYSAQGFLRNRDSAPFFVWIITTVAMAVGLGVIWPSIPIIYAWRVRTERIRRRNHTSCVASEDCRDPECRYR